MRHDPPVVRSGTLPGYLASVGMRLALAVVAIVCLSGCTDAANREGTATASSAATASRSPKAESSRVRSATGAATAQSPAPTSGQVTVDTKSVAGVRLGTEANDAERRLRQALGLPVSAELPDCNGEIGRTLTWKSLTAYLSDSGNGGTVRLSGWSVEAGPTAKDIALPYDTAVGEAMREVLSKVPAATGLALEEGPYAGRFAVTTERAPGLLWLSSNQRGQVTAAAFQAVSCD